MVRNESNPGRHATSKGWSANGATSTLSLASPKVGSRSRAEIPRAALEGRQWGTNSGAPLNIRPAHRNYGTPLCIALPTPHSGCEIDDPFIRREPEPLG